MIWGMTSAIKFYCRQSSVELNRGPNINEINFSSNQISTVFIVKFFTFISNVKCRFCQSSFGISRDAQQFN